MKPTQTLQAAGQSLWLDNITRGMLHSGELARYLDDYTVTGLTSNPSIFENAFTTTSDYDAAIAEGAAAGRSGEELFFDLALEDLQGAAEVFAGVHAATDGVDGWVSLEVSPLLAYDAASTVDAAVDLHHRAQRSNLFIKIPGTPEGLPAIEEAIFRGVPVNVTLLFSVHDYLAAAQAYLRGIERRIEVGLDPRIGSVASVFMSRWDTAVAAAAPQDLRNRLGLAIGQQVFRAYTEHLAGERFQMAATAGARPQRLLFASTSTKDPLAPDTLYVSGLAAPGTVNTLPDATLKAFADHGTLEGVLAGDGGDSEQVLAAFAAAGIDVDQVGRSLQTEGAAAFVRSWHGLLGVIEGRSAILRGA